VSIAIRPLELPAALDEVAAFHNANRSAPAPPRRFAWAYLENPDGMARGWGAYENDALVGIGMVFPRTIRLAGGRRVRAWTPGDLSVAATHRRRGIASRLRAATRDAVDAGEAALLFSIPNPQAAKVHDKVGLEQLGPMKRLVRPLAVPRPRVLRELTRRPVQWVIRGHAARPLPSRVLSRGAEVDELEALAGLYEQAVPTTRASVVRSAAYLRWRFLDNERSPAQLLVARAGAQVVGYAALVDRGDSLYLRDWLVASSELLPALVASVVEQANRTRKAWLSLSALEGHPDLAVLAQCGFRTRADATDVKVYVPAAAPAYGPLRQAAGWWLTGGDPDI